MDMTATEFLQRARDHEQQHRYGEGLEDCNAALALDPHLAEAYVQQAKLFFFSLGSRFMSHLPTPSESERAVIVADFDRAVQFAPNNIPVLMECAQWLTLFQGLGRRDQGIEICTAVIALDPSLRQAYFMRGTAYQMQQRYAEALVDYTHAIELDPNDAGGYAARGQCYENQRQRALAAADFRRALELGHADFRTQYMRDYVGRYGKLTPPD